MIIKFLDPNISADYISADVNLQLEYHMHTNIRSLLSILCILALYPASSFGQKVTDTGPLSTPLDPGVAVDTINVGIVIGPGWNIQSGEAFVYCDECLFEGGAGSGFLFGILAEYGVSESVIIGSRFMIEGRGMLAEYTELGVPTTMITQTTNEEIVVDIDFLHELDMSVTMLDISPYIQWYPFGGLFLQAGPSLGLALSSEYTHKQTVLTRQTVGPSGEIIEITPNTDPQLAPEGATLEGYSVVWTEEVRDVVTPQLGINTGIGFDIEFGEDVFFTPLYVYRTPLGLWSEHGNDFKLAASQLLFSLKWKL